MSPRTVAAPLGAALLVCSAACGPPGSGDLLDDLADALDGYPLLEARLSIARPDLRCAEAPAACAPLPSIGGPEHAEVLAVVARARRVLERGPDADALHAIALADVLWATPSGIELDRSVQLLEEANRLQPDAGRLGDLAAVHLVRAERGGGWRDLMIALDVAGRAMDEDPDAAHASHNHALALERLGLVRRAASAWTEHATREGSGYGASVARRRAADLNAGGGGASVGTDVEGGDPQLGRIAVMDSLLGGWARAYLGGRPAAADSLLRVAGETAAPLDRPGRDRSAPHAVAAVRSALEEGNARELARAHVAYLEGRALWGQARYQEARGRLATVDELLGADAETPLAQWARFFHAATVIYGSEYELGDSLLALQAGRVNGELYPALVGRIAWARGVSQQRQGRAQNARRHYEIAAAAFEAAGEPEHLGAVTYLLGEAYWNLGDVVSALDAMTRAHRALSARPPTVWLHNLLRSLAVVASETGLTHAAVEIQDEGVRVARSIGSPIYTAEALLARAALHAWNDDREAAERALDDATREIERIVSPEGRAWMEADRQAVVAELSVGEDPMSAATSLDAVVAHFTRVGSQPRLLPPLVSRADAWLGLGDADRARDDLAAAVGIIERQLATLSEGEIRGLAFAAARGAYDRLVALHLDRGDDAEALRWALRARPLSFGGAPAGGSAASGAAMPVDGRPGSGVSAPAAFPMPSGAAGTTAVAYHVWNDTLAVWTIDASGIRASVRPGDGARLAALVEDVGALAARSAAEDAFRAPLEELHRLLVPPSAAAADTIVFWPDAQLDGVPFSALRSPETGRYLVEDHAVVVRLRPVTGDDGAGTRVRRPPRRILVVASAASYHGPDGFLPALPFAEEEAGRIAGLYGDGALLVGGAESGGVFSGPLDADVLHFAGHAVVDRRRPTRSYLVAGPGEAPVRTTAARIRGLDLSGLSLAVLSGCRTLGAQHGAAGFTGLAAAFLDAGAGGVVGTLWDVDDRAAADFVVEMHERYRASGDAEAALLETRRAYLARTERRSPALWAGFRHVTASH